MHILCTYSLNSRIEEAFGFEVASEAARAAHPGNADRHTSNDDESLSTIPSGEGDQEGQEYLYFVLPLL